MEFWHALSDGGAAHGLAGGSPAGLLAGVLALLGALTAWVAVLLAAGHLPPWLRRAVPTRLRPRLTLALVLLAMIPALALAVALAERATLARAGEASAQVAAEAVARSVAAAPPGATAAAGAPAPDVGALRLREYGVAAGWLLAALVVAVVLANAVAGAVAEPLAALDRAVRELDPELQREPARAPRGAPREVAVVFEHLAGLTQRLRESIGQLQDSLRSGERLRSELVRVIETREQEIAGRTQQLKIANESLDRLSRLDALTGVANRRGLAEQLDRAWRAALRDQQPLSVLMIDIDHFKAYNDSYGHQQGDSCIKAVATSIRHVAGRANDVVARYGGEEFVAILGDTPLEGALQVAEQIRAAVESMNVPHLAAPGRAVVTVSVGVTSVVPTRGSRPDAALLAADRALYAAKEQGRNRVGYSSAARTGIYKALSLPGDPAGRPS